jgi:hypothetical protein
MSRLAWMVILLFVVPSSLDDSYTPLCTPLVKMNSSELFGLGTTTFLTSASQVARITGMSHQPRVYLSYGILFIPPSLT